MDNLIIKIIIFAWCLLDFLFVGIIGTLKIATTEEIDTYHANECLKDKVQFLRCVFMYQVALKERFEDEINILGIIILEILITINAWAFNVLIFVTLISCICAKGIWNGFCFIFKKKNKISRQEVAE